MRKALLWTAVGAAASAMLGGIAWSAIPSADGVIHGCYQKNTGKLRVVERGQDCRRSEVAVSWNHTGPQGERGPQGKQGPPGPAAPSPPAPLVDWPTKDVEYTLEVPGLPGFPVEQVAGCVPLSFGALPPDCQLEIAGLPPGLVAWLNDAITGTNPVQTLTLRAFSYTGMNLGQYQLDRAFVTKATLSALDAAGNGALVSTIDVAANGFGRVSPTPDPGTAAPVANDFTLSLDGVTLGGIAKISGLEVDIPRVGTTSVTPGTPSFGRIAVTAAEPGAATLESWAEAVASGTGKSEDAKIDLLGETGALVGSIHLGSVVPVAPPSPPPALGQSVAELAVGSMSFTG